MADDLSKSMLAALEQMPIKLKNYGGEGYSLPHGSPSGGTLKALQRRGLARSDLHRRQWIRTPLGDEALEARPDA